MSERSEEVRGTSRDKNLLDDDRRDRKYFGFLAPLPSDSVGIDVVLVGRAFMYSQDHASPIPSLTMLIPTPSSVGGGQPHLPCKVLHEMNMAWY
jgi:hypothetical protein